MRTSLRWCLRTWAAVLWMAPLPLLGQSVLAAGGLGVPMDGLTARGRALGSAGPGLFGGSILPGDPAAALDLALPTAAFSFQSGWIDIEEGGTASSYSGSRFPALGVSYPVRGWGTVTLTYEGVLDQRWGLVRDDVIDLGGDEVPVRDRFVSDGGVSAARFGFARRIAPSLGVGVTVGAYTGTVLRRFSRSFDSLGVSVGIDPFQAQGRWNYSGFTTSVGAVVDLGDVARVAGTLGWSTDLDAEATEGTLGSSRSYAMPLEVRGGASGALAPGLTAALNVAWANWSTTAPDLLGTLSVNTLALGAGLEWEGASMFGRTLPLRLGWHRENLPFHFEGEEPTESTLSGGIGWVMSSAGSLSLAQVDLAVERGDRSAGSVSEAFWRSTLTLRVSGF